MMSVHEKKGISIQSSEQQNAASSEDDERQRKREDTFFVICGKYFRFEVLRVSSWNRSQNQDLILEKYFFKKLERDQRGQQRKGRETEHLLLHTNIKTLQNRLTVIRKINTEVNKDLSF